MNNNKIRIMRYRNNTMWRKMNSGEKLSILDMIGDKLGIPSFGRTFVEKKEEKDGRDAI